MPKVKANNITLNYEQQGRGVVIAYRYSIWLILASLLAGPAAPFGGLPWDKAPEKWNQADAYRILQDSPWSPTTGVKIDAKATLRHTDRQTGLITDDSVDPYNNKVVPEVRFSREKPQPAVPVLWWSSKTVRLAQQRLRQLREPSKFAGALRVEELADYILVIEGSEPVRILQDSKEDLHDTVFLELGDGATLDLGTVLFFEGSPEEEARVEFHFPKQVDGRATLDSDAERVILHCKGTAKTPRAGHRNVLAVRAEFKPQAMRVNGLPDL